MEPEAEQQPAKKQNTASEVAKSRPLPSATTTKDEGLQKAAGTELQEGTGTDRKELGIREEQEHLLHITVLDLQTQLQQGIKVMEAACDNLNVVRGKLRIEISASRKILQLANERRAEVEDMEVDGSDSQ